MKRCPRLLLLAALLALALLPRAALASGAEPTRISIRDMGPLTYFDDQNMTVTLPVGSIIYVAEDSYLDLEGYKLILPSQSSLELRGAVVANEAHPSEPGSIMLDGNDITVNIHCDQSVDITNVSGINIVAFHTPLSGSNLSYTGTLRGALQAEIHASSGARVTFTQPNAHTGATLIDGTLALVDDGALLNSTVVGSGTGDRTLDLTGRTNAAPIKLSDIETEAIDLAIGDTPCTVGAGYLRDVTGGPGALVKSGDGTLTLTGVASLGGALTVQQGEVALTGTTAPAIPGGIAIAGGATLSANPAAFPAAPISGDGTLNILPGTKNLDLSLDEAFTGTLSVGSYVRLTGSPLSLKAVDVKDKMNFVCMDATQLTIREALTLNNGAALGNHGTLLFAPGATFNCAGGRGDYVSDGFIQFGPGVTLPLTGALRFREDYSPTLFAPSQNLLNTPWADAHLLTLNLNGGSLNGQPAVLAARVHGNAFDLASLAAHIAPPPGATGFSHWALTQGAGTLEGDAMTVTSADKRAALTAVWSYPYYPPTPVATPTPTPAPTPTPTPTPDPLPEPNVFLRTKPLMVKGKQGLFTSMRSLKYDQDGNLLVTMYVYNRTRRAFPAEKGLTFTLTLMRDGQTVAQRLLSPLAMQKRLPSLRFKVFRATLPKDALPNAILNLADTRTQLYLEGNLARTPFTPVDIHTPQAAKPKSALFDGDL